MGALLQLQVTCAPETMAYKRNSHDELLVLCCDGIWDVMSNEVCLYHHNAYNITHKQYNCVSGMTGRNVVTRCIVEVAHVLSLLASIK
jgi:serine/threonine protein phosphatase PrpC